MEFTQEQVNEMIAEATKGMFTQSDLDKRVRQASDTVRENVRKELEQQSKLTAEELAKQQYEEKVAELTAKENDLKRKFNKVSAQEMLSGKNIAPKHYENMMDLLLSDDEAVTKANVDNFIKMFEGTKSELETSLRTELLNVKPPAGGTGSDKPKSFDTMSYQERMEFKEKHPEEFAKQVASKKKSIY